MTVRARIADDLRDTGELAADAAVLVADGKVYPACTPDAAFDLWMTYTRWLAEKMQPSARWQALLVGLRHAEVAVADDRRSAAAPIMNASRVLEVAKAKLGPDVYAKLRQALVAEMMGRGS